MFYLFIKTTDNYNLIIIDKYVDVSKILKSFGFNLRGHICIGHKLYDVLEKELKLSLLNDEEKYNLLSDYLDKISKK